jgi:hypothetical protein
LGEIKGLICQGFGFIQYPQGAVGLGDDFEQRGADLRLASQLVVDTGSAAIEQVPCCDGLAAGRIRSGRLKHTSEELRFTHRDFAFAVGSLS